MTAFPKPLPRQKIDPRWRRPHRFEEAHDDPAPAPNCWNCLKPRDHRIHRARSPIGQKRTVKKRAQNIPQLFPKPEPKRGTKHSRRAREWGYMAFCHARGCELCLDVGTQELLGIGCPGSGPLEFAHLSAKKRYDAGDIGTCLHQDTHRGIDGRIGGKLPWYVALGKAGQLLIRQRLANRARAAWDALAGWERDLWNRRAAARRRKA